MCLVLVSINLFHLCVYGSVLFKNLVQQQGHITPSWGMPENRIRIFISMSGLSSLEYTKDRLKKTKLGGILDYVWIGN